jgi:hypothetical protein
MGCGEGTGSCVPTPTMGELCMKRCDSDAQCRAQEGYVCDALWHACALPNLASIVPTVCPALPTAPVQDTAFAPSQRWSGERAATFYESSPSAVIADDGGVIALYTSRDPLHPAAPLVVSRIDGKGVATLEQPLPPNGSIQDDPRVARDRKGTVYAAWHEASAETRSRQISLAISTDRGATWSPQKSVHDPADCAVDEPCLGSPMLAVGPDPRQPGADVVYVLYPTKLGGLRVRASRDRGVTFGPAVTAATGGRGNAIVGSNGTLHVVTLDGGPGGGFGSAQHPIQYTSSSDGGATFRPPVTVSGFQETLPYFFSNPSIAIDSARKLLYVAYVRGGRDAKWEIVLAISKDGGATWRRQQIAGDGCAIHMVPSLAIDPATGAVHLAYYDSVAAPGRFVHLSCASGGARCKVHGAINTAPFASLSTGRFARTSIGEYASLLVDGKRRTLHAVWAQVVDEAGAKVSRIFHSSAKLK